MPRPTRPAACCLGFAMALVLVQAQEPPAPAQGAWTLQGDLGLGVFGKRSHVVGREDSLDLLPFGYATWGPLFWRVDTFGVEAFHFGHGAFEIAGRIDFENSTNPQSGFGSLFRGENAVPVGIGTFQRMPWGGLFAHVYQDVGASSGQLAEVRYAAKLAVYRLVLYPQAALEWRSATFNQPYYGVEPGNSESLPAYRAGASVSPVLALAGEWPLSRTWFLNAQVRRKWLDASVADSPRVQRGTVDDGYLAVSYRFQ